MCPPCHKTSYLGTKCPSPPVPPNSTNLEVVWDGSLIDFDSPIEYRCKRGMKFKANFGGTKQVATCRKGNLWEKPPSWLDCVESMG